jgi:hypothetical protein
VPSIPFRGYNTGGCFPGNKATGDHSFAFHIFKISSCLGHEFGNPAGLPGNDYNCISLCFGKTVFKLILGRKVVRRGGEWNALEWSCERYIILLFRY